MIFLGVYQLWFWPALNGTPEIFHIAQESMQRYIFALMALSIVAEILLFRDLYLRRMKDKFGWVVALLLFSAVAAPLYYFKHARYPRSVVA